MASSTTHRARRPRQVGRTLVTVAVVTSAVAVSGLRTEASGTTVSPQAYAAEALTAMDSGYYAHGPRWQQARAQAVRDTRDASTYAETLPALRRALTVAGGRHSGLRAPSQHGRPTPPRMPTVKTSGCVTTVTVPAFTSSDQAALQRYADTMADGIAAARKGTTCGWVVDLRDNLGGDMRPMLAGLSQLITPGKVAGFVDRHGRTTDVTVRDGAVRIGPQKVAAVKARPFANQPVAVLQGPRTASSGEIALLAFRGAAHTRAFGAGTAGYSSANVTLPLRDGAQLVLTTAMGTDRTGTRYGGMVRPQQRTPVATAHHAGARWVEQQRHH